MKLSPPTRVSETATPAGPPPPRRRAVPVNAPSRGFGAALWRRRFYLLFAVLPTLLAGIYLYGFATGQYVSEARYLVRGRQMSSGTGSLDAMLGAAGFKSSSEEALAVRDYLHSANALEALQKNVRLTELYRRPEADLLARLWIANPPLELLQLYHNSMSNVQLDTTSGISTLRSRAFRAEDAQAITEQQLRLAEDFVNQLSSRARDETLRIAQLELERAEERVRSSQAALTAWRQREQAVDPSKNAEIGLTSVAALESALTLARAELQEKSAYMRTDNPQIATLRNRIASLQSEIRDQRRRLTLGGEDLPTQLAAYERLMLEREFADKQLGSATASLETARLDAQRQQMFLARVVAPSLAEYPLYPRAWIILISMFLVLSVLYGIGWMLVSGMREHAF